MAIRFALLLLVVMLHAGCHVALAPAAREANVIARFVDSARCGDGAYQLARVRPQQHSRLSPQLYSAAYTIDECGQHREMTLMCDEGPRVADHDNEGTRLRCFAIGTPAIDESIPSAFAPELVALTDRLHAAFPCAEHEAFRIVRSGHFGDAQFIVSACGTEHRFHVECETSDAGRAMADCHVVER